jgi:hypothetical protein
MIEFVVENQLWVNVEKDEAEWWPHIVAYSQENRPKHSKLASGANTTAMLAWDLIEACLGGPPAGHRYRIQVTAEPGPIIDQGSRFD